MAFKFRFWCTVIFFLMLEATVALAAVGNGTDSFFKEFKTSNTKLTLLAQEINSFDKQMDSGKELFKEINLDIHNHKVFSKSKKNLKILASKIMKNELAVNGVQASLKEIAQDFKSSIKPLLKSDTENILYNDLTKNRIQPALVAFRESANLLIADIGNGKDSVTPDKDKKKAKEKEQVKEENEDKGKDKDKEKQKEELSATKKFLGANFGLAVSLTVDTGSNDRIESARIEDGVVRVEQDKNDIPRFMLESHYLAPFGGSDGIGPWNWCKEFSKKNNEPIKPKCGIGPFVGIVTGDEDLINAIGFGFMIGLRRGPDSQSSFNFGVGGVLDPEVRTLGDGFIENQAPPGAETEVRYKDTSQWGILGIFSFTF